MSMSKGILYLVTEYQVEAGEDIIGLFNDRDDAIKAAREHKPSWSMGDGHSPVSVQAWHQGTVQWEFKGAIEWRAES